MAEHVNSFNFGAAVDDLRTVYGRCTDLQRIATPYVQAAGWEKSTGNSVIQAVGQFAATDMQYAVEKLTGVAKDCLSCGVAGAVCMFAGVERMTQEEILTLVEG